MTPGRRNPLEMAREENRTNPEAMREARRTASKSSAPFSFPQRWLLGQDVSNRLDR